MIALSSHVLQAAKEKFFNSPSDLANATICGTNAPVEMTGTKP